MAAIASSSSGCSRSTATINYVGMDFVDPPVDFAGIAKSLGLEAIRITDPGQLKSTLSSAFSRPGAKLIEVVVNNAVN